MARGYTYHRQLADVYEHSPFFGRDSQARIQFYIDEAQSAGGPVLEVGAATGLYTLALARVGLQVQSLDISPEMLQFVQERLDQESRETQAHVTLTQADMRSFQLDTKFRTALLPGNVLLAATSIEDQLRTLRCVNEHLEENGTLILDVFAPDRALIGRGADYSWCQFSVPHTGTTYFCHRHVNVEPFQQLLRIRFIHEELDDDGNLSDRRVDVINFRYIYPNELRLALHIAGFRIKHMYGDFSNRQTKADYDGYVVVVAQKSKLLHGK
jgi:SAM-dependent methyltransferase